MLKILLIDDEPKLLEDMLNMYGYTVKVATDGFSGLQTLLDTDERYDLVILDVQMPRMDGWAVLKTIRNGDKHANIPIIMLTSSDTEEALVTGLRRGADEYLTKPITPRKLFAYIDAIARRMQWESESSYKGSDEGDDNALHETINVLTQRETEILKHIVKGYSNQQIGEKLVISETTVKNHLANIYKKLNVSNRTQAAFLAQKLKLF
jgi:RNA polymerase sigma factor (sigma-70 family)